MQIEQSLSPLNNSETTTPLRLLPEFPKIDGCAFYALIKAIQTLQPQTTEAQIRQFLRMLNPETSPLPLDDTKDVINFPQGSIKFEVYHPEDANAQSIRQLFDRIFRLSQLPLTLRFIDSRLPAADLFAIARQQQGFLLAGLSFYTRKKLELLSEFYGKDMFTYEILELKHRIGIAVNPSVNITIHDLNESELKPENITQLLDQRDQRMYYKTSKTFGEVFCKASKLPMVLMQSLKSL